MCKLLKVDRLYKNIKKGDEKNILIDNLSFEIYYGEAVAMVCPSESSMTQLLYLLSGLNFQYDGTIQYHKNIEDKLHYKILYTSKKDVLYEWRTVLDNILLYLDVNKGPGTDNKAFIQIVSDLFDQYDLTEYKDKYPSTLSVGIKSKISFIKHFLLKPDLLILDDCFSNMDYKTKTELLKILRNDFLKENNALIYATKNMEDAFLLADRVLLLTSPPLSLKASVDISDMGSERSLEQIQENPVFHEMSSLLSKN